MVKKKLRQFEVWINTHLHGVIPFYIMAPNKSIAKKKAIKKYLRQFKPEVDYIEEL